MVRGLTMVLPALVAGAVWFAVPSLAQFPSPPPATAEPQLAQVQSQPVPPPAGTPSAPPAAPSTKSEPPKTEAPKTESSKTPTPLTKPAPTARSACPDNKVDINAASAEELRKLPQIGVQRSNAIVKARPYARPEDLLTKKVVKKAVYEKIKSCIVASDVAPGTTPPRRKPPAAKPPAAGSTSTAPATPVPVPAASGPTAVGTPPASKPQQ